MTRNTIYFLLILGLIVTTAWAKPAPQESADDQDIKKDDEKDGQEDEKEEVDPTEVVGQVFGGLFSIFNTAIQAAQEFATNEEVVDTVGEIVDVGVKTSVQAAKTAVDIAAEAPKIVEESAPLVEGLAKTVSETSGFVGGSIDELEQTAQLVSVFAEAYTNHTVEQLDNFLKVFNRRLKCNTTCKKLKEDTTDRAECEKKFCEGFVPPKTKKQLEEERLKFVEEYEYDYSEEDGDEPVEADVEIIE